ncbi:MAG: carbon-nitrogen hydrolase family protein, partial [Defluviitaleaceae bacterium]|nr:carbon-nitrogen hydrolase family protein [Defluviitaleaceae bacterium]
LAEERVSAFAKRRGVRVCACYFTRRGGKNYNTAGFFDRAGSLAGYYDKTHLPPDETWQLTPGDDLNVIQLDDMTVGALICYDMMFPEPTETLALKGAEIIMHPTAGYGWYDAIGEATLRARANDNSVYIVAAKNYSYFHAGNSSVVDPWGHVLANAGFYENAITVKEIDLDKKKEQAAWHNPSVMSGETDVAKRMRAQRRPELYGALAEPIPAIEPPDEAKRVKIREMIINGECRWW